MLPVLGEQSKFLQLLKSAHQVRASDIHLATDLPARLRVHGALLELPDSVFSEPEIWAILRSVAGATQLDRFEFRQHLDASWSWKPYGRFRLHFARSEGKLSLSVRPIETQPTTFRELSLPDQLSKLFQHRSGLILVAGSTGAGKSTTMRAMIQEINRSEARHILTIEDPIEFIFENQLSLITQQEIGRDVADFPSAIRGALRHDPDVLVIGELRDRESMQAALTAAETGHLVIATIHSSDTVEVITRVVSMFDPEARIHVRNQLAQVLRGVVGMRLVPSRKLERRIPAVEILVATDRIRDMIRQGQDGFDWLEYIENSASTYHMQSFDQSLIKWLQRGVLSREEVLAFATRPTLAALRMNGIESLHDHLDAPRIPTGTILRGNHDGELALEDPDISDEREFWSRPLRRSQFRRELARASRKRRRRHPSLMASLFALAGLGVVWAMNAAKTPEAEPPRAISQLASSPVDKKEITVQRKSTPAKARRHKTR